MPGDDRSHHERVPRAPLRELVIRIATIVVTGATGAFITYQMQPIIAGTHAKFPAGASAVFCALVGYAAIGQPILGWVEEDETNVRIPMSTRHRVIMFSIGVILVLGIAVALPWIDLHMTDDHV